ncbi:DEP domain-containing mTOR-interacting protein-like [Micropterus dolomieu]|uniref:DEP domain-containing mTOR-interacting protein-like n=1 Tax=Micropterus dolomieu TaxID=147949 RepID=UPI001E8D1A58|nr:DEP domain-containing mTOR-interacting protein-like [Micropterus dolomieu]
MNFRRRRRLIELLHERGRSIPESHDSPFCLRKQNSDGGNTSFLSVSPTKEIKVVVGVRRSSMSSSCGSSGYYSSSPTLSSSPPVLCNPKSDHCLTMNVENWYRSGRDGIDVFCAYWQMNGSCVKPFNVLIILVMSSLRH